MKKRLYVLTNLSLIALLISASTAFSEEGLIGNLLAGNCIDVIGAPGVANGTRLQLSGCELSGRTNNGQMTDQMWRISDGFIINTLSGKCIDVAGSPGTANGAALQLWDCELSGRNKDNGSMTDQRWSFLH